MQVGKLAVGFNCLRWALEMTLWSDAHERIKNC